MQSTAPVRLIDAATYPFAARMDSANNYRVAMFRTRSTICGVVFALLMVNACTESLPPGAWRFQNVDGSGGIATNAEPTRQWSGSVTTVTFRGMPHYFGVDKAAGSLLHTWMRDGNWRVEILDAGNAAAVTGPLAAVSNDDQILVIGVVQRSANIQGLTTWTYSDGGGWASTISDPNVSPRTPSIIRIPIVAAVGPAADPVVYAQVQLGYPTGPAELAAVSVADVGTGQQSNRWFSGLVDTTSGIPIPANRVRSGFGLAVAQRSSTTWVYYADANSGDLFADRPDDAAPPQIVDGDGIGSHLAEEMSTETSSIIDTTGQPHAFYVARPSGVLRHAWLTANGWISETLDGVSGGERSDSETIGALASALIDGKPHVFYGTRLRGTSGPSDILRHAWWDGSRWRIENFDGFIGANGQRDSNVPTSAPAVTVIGGRPFVGYSTSETGALRIADWR